MGVALDLLERALDLRRRQGAGAQQPGPAENRVERRPQLVRQRREELVLQAVRFAQLGFALLDLMQHPVEGVDQHAELVVGDFLGADRIVPARRHVGRGPRELQDRIGNEGLEPERKHPGEAEGGDEQEAGDHRLHLQPRHQHAGVAAQHHAAELLAGEEAGRGVVEPSGGEHHRVGDGLLRAIRRLSAARP